MTRRYRWQAPVFNLTRWPILLGRRRLISHLQPTQRVVEIGCGTGHNLRPLQQAAGTASQVIGIECAATMAQRARRHARPGIEILELEFGEQSVGTVNAAVFSYALSMIPDYGTALDRIAEDLCPDGQILVLDFVDSPVPAVRRIMQGMGVHLGEDRWTALRSRFAVSLERDFKAFGGLWNYRMLIGRQPTG